MSLRQFKIVSKLGEGSFGQVLKVKRISNGKQYALKKVKFGHLIPKDIQNALNEVRILASLEAENIIAYKDAFFDNESSTLCIVMEFADGGDLQQKIGQKFRKNTHFEEDQIWKVAHNLLSGLKVLQQNKILHRDIKSANIFFVNGIAKLGDMNVSKITECSLAYTQTGTPYYASPEVWRDEPYSYKSDIWSLGCVLYEMCALKPPFRAKSLDELFKKVQKGNYEKIPSKYSNTLANFVNECLIVDVTKRSNCDILLQICQIYKTKEKKLFKHTSLENISLLETIKAPKFFKQLNQILPKSKYENERQTTKNIDKLERRQKRIGFLQLFEKKKQRKSIELPKVRLLRQIKSQKYLPAEHVKYAEPTSSKVLPDIPSFKSIIHQIPLQKSSLLQQQRYEQRYRQVFQRQRKCLINLSQKQRLSLQAIQSSIKHARIK